MAFTQCFPNEILRLIFCQLCSHCSGPPVLISSPPSQEKHLNLAGCHTLWSLCLVSRDFRDLAQPLLYHQFVFGYEHGYEMDGPSPLLEQRFHSFTRMIIQRRDFARMVRRLYLHPNLFNSLYGVNNSFATLLLAAPILRPDLFSNVEDAPMYVVAQEESKLKELFISKAGHAFRKVEYMFDDDIYFGIELVTTLLALLPNLDHVVLKEFNNWPITRGSEPPFALRVFGVSDLAIKTIETSWSMQSFVNITCAAVQLENLTLHDCYLRPEEIPIAPMPNLKNLAFTSCALGIEEIKLIVSQCTGSLRKFLLEEKREEIYRQYPLMKRNVFETVSCHPRDLVELLDAHCQTLQILHLDYRSSRQRLRLPNLTKFTSLTHLFYGTYSLSHILNTTPYVDVHDNTLPRSLNCLTIAGEMLFHKRCPRGITQTMRRIHKDQLLDDDVFEDEEWLCKGMLSLAKAKQDYPETFTNLRYVNCVSSDVPGATAAATEIFANANVAFGFHVRLIDEYE